MISQNDTIVFYDGDCGFCNRSIAVILKYRKTDNIKFCPLQSVFTEDTLSKFNEKIQYDSFYFLNKNKVFIKSNAAIEISKLLKWPYSWLPLGKIVPIRIRDYIYDIVAKRRHKLSKDYCYMPSENEKKMFI